MLLYAQDEVGHISNELIEEVARRCQVQPLQVDEVVGYYSMLHRKPLGKCHVQVCTNISCLILGGGRTVRARLEEARNRKQGSDAGRAVFARRSGVHGRVQLGAGHPAQLRLPSSCDAGEIGSTIGECQKGAVNMADSDPITKKDLANTVAEIKMLVREVQDVLLGHFRNQMNTHTMRLDAREASRYGALATLARARGADSES